ncbi:MAG TPA: phage tail protein [Bryobacteraceae bacterium]|nr:phage tail protein [Bryobacteraceae bacterium]
MANIHDMKRVETPDTPVLLFECVLRDGRTERWATHSATVDGESYQARVLKHNSFELRAGSEDGVDAAGRFVVTLDNVDGYVSQLERTVGLKASKLTVRMAFVDLETGTAVTDPVTVFLGAANPPEELAETYARLSFASRLSLQRVNLPQLRVQSRCPWAFPTSQAQREEAANGGSESGYSAFYGCGYSPDVVNGIGTSGAEGPYTSCAYTKTDCQARGMFDKDAQHRPTARFGGYQFLPPSVMVRAYGEKDSALSESLDNRAKSNDAAPLVYGTNWYQPPVVYTRSDGNLTHCEVLLGAGEMEVVHKVVASGVEIPAGETGKDMGSTGWYNVVSLGGRNGGFNLNFTDASGQPIGDPHGSMAILAVAIPNKLNDGSSIPQIEVLADGIKLERFDTSGISLGKAFTRNPAWVLLDVLRRSGWKLGELNIASFAASAIDCDELIEVKDAFGNARTAPKFEVNLALLKRKSAADVARGIRTAAALMLTFGADGKLQLTPEGTIARQQPVKPEYSNAAETLGGGWPAYEFGDGTNGTTGILRRAGGEPALRLWARSTAESPNRWSVEFQNSFNEYQQDSVSLLDLDDVLAAGQELSATVPALGLPHFDQAARVTRFQLMKSLMGNMYVEFDTGTHALGLRPGDIISLTYLREGLERAPFRITKLAPSENYLTTRIVAQRHDDEWYELLAAGWQEGEERRRANGRWGLSPRPITGVSLDEQGRALFGIEEELADGSGTTVRLKVRYTKPETAEASPASVPIVGLSPLVETSGGALAGGQSWYYAVSALDASGKETELSFAVRASVPAGAENRVTLRELSFAPGTAGFRVYRGANPSRLLRIEQVSGTAAAFTDAGLAAQCALPVDANFDHANFYWRTELMPETAVAAASATTLTGVGLAMPANEFRSAVVRITQGKGEGQERVVLSHDGAAFELQTPWTTTPDGTSQFVVAEAAWRFGAATRTDQVQFETPNRPDVFVQISGRAANVLDSETDAELSPLDRYRIGGEAGGDMDTPSEPAFSLSVEKSGEVWLTGIGFETLENTSTIASGTLVLRYSDESAESSAVDLAGSVAAAEEWISMDPASSAVVGDLLQVEREMMRVIEVTLDGQVLRVERGVLGSTAAAHVMGAEAETLRRLAVVAPFQKEFFGSSASGSYTLPITLKNARIAAAEFYVTNRIGDSPTAVSCYTGLTDRGLRTYAGGQFTIQVEGDLAIETSVAPPLIIEENRSVAEIRAVVAEAPVGGGIQLRVRLNGLTYCDLTIANGTRMSAVVSGAGLGRLLAGSEITLDVISVPTGAGTRPGRNLMVAMKL